MKSDETKVSVQRLNDVAMGLIEEAKLTERILKITMDKGWFKFNEIITSETNIVEVYKQLTHLRMSIDELEKEIYHRAKEVNDAIRNDDVKNNGNDNSVEDEIPPSDIIGNPTIPEYRPGVVKIADTIKKLFFRG